jgi:hypothetical protein
VGSAEIKVGVYDDGFRWSHEDFGDGTWEGSKFEGGRDYLNNENQLSETIDSGSGHGTKVAGIIGALRNNEIGIAGIAGGNSADVPDNKGVSLYGFRVLAPMSLLEVYSTADVVANAMGEGAAYLIDNQGNPTWGYGLHIMNNSLSVKLDDLLSLGVPNITILFETHQSIFSVVNEFVAQNGCVNVCSRGNYNSVLPNSPCITNVPESYVLQVGASNSAGVKLTGSSYSGIDFLAPGQEEMIYTTNNLTNSSYSNFVNTSAATPHVAGVAALMLSEINTNTVVPNTLDPEDVEVLLEKYAEDVDPIEDEANVYFPGNDDHSGHGIVNAGKVMEHIEWPYYKIRHIEGVTSFDDVESVQEDVLLDFENVDGFQNGVFYLCDIYTIEKIISFDFSPETIIDAWPRSAQSNLLAASADISPFAHVEVIAWNLSSVTVRGYLYYINSYFSGFELIDVNQWYPHSPAQGNVSASLHTHDGTLQTQEVEDTSNSSIMVIPNPTNGNSYLVYNAHSSDKYVIQVYDAAGELVFDGYSGIHSTGRNHFQLECSHWPSGLYLCKLTTPAETHYCKFIKE